MSRHETETASTPSALLLIDFQRDFLDPHGRLPVAAHHVEPMIEATQRAIRSRPGSLVIKIANAFPADARIANLARRNAAIADSPGAAWDLRVDAESAAFMTKWKSDAFCNPELQHLLDEHGVGEVAVAGLYARGCVAATVRSALRHGYAVSLLADSIACRSDASKGRALARLQRRGATLA